MKKEDLIAWGLSEEQAQKVMDGLDGNYVPKSRFNELNEENKNLKAAAKEHETQLADLKKTAGDNAEIKKQLEEMQSKNAELEKTHKAQIQQLKLDNAMENAISASGCKNNKAVKALLDMAKIKFENDQLTGLDEQLKELVKTDAYLFDEKKASPSFKGFVPGNPNPDGDPKNTDVSKMTYTEMLAYLEANPDAKI